MADEQSEYSYRVVLDEAGFQALVRGEVVWLRGERGEVVELTRSDIGYDRMEAAVAAARAEVA